MSLNDLFNAGGLKPKVVYQRTSSTGVYVPSVAWALCYFELCGGGGGGHATSAGGGGAAMIRGWLRVPVGGIAWTIGAAGAVGANGSNSVLGHLIAMGGSFDTSGSGDKAFGGVAALIGGGVNTTGVLAAGVRGLDGVDGGQGGSSSFAGLLAGVPSVFNSAFNVSPMNNLYTRLGNGQGNGSGGNSFYGKGGVSGAAPAADAWGAGGGIGAAGRGGYLEIRDFGGFGL